MPQIATGYGKMLPENDCTEPVITNKTGEKVNEITGFSNDKTGAPPLTTTGFELHKKKGALVALVKREYDITGYVASRMVRPKSLRKIVNYTQPVLIEIIYSVF